MRLRLRVWILVATVLSGMGLPGPAAWAEKYYDLYLTDNRLCKKCAWRWVDAEHVEIWNHLGQRGVVEGKEILAYDKHSLGRRLFKKSVHGVGLPGKIIVPYAFDDYKDFTCKYCDP